ncbi:MAG: pilin [Candidatus Saccharibacteria bacterium]|nr:pilin [Candidatus Saccharibacteria bacterium]
MSPIKILSLNLIYLYKSTSRLLIIASVSLLFLVGIQIAIFNQSAHASCSIITHVTESACEAADGTWTEPASTTNSIQGGVQEGIVTAGGDNNVNAEESLKETVNDIISILGWIVGIVSVLMLIYAGLRYIVSGGSEKGVTAAKKTIIYAVIGLVVVLLSQTLVRYIFDQFLD